MIVKPNFFLIAGPCVIESREHCHKMASEIKAITSKLNIPYIFKASFDKANRTSLDSFRGIGMQEGLEILNEIREVYKIPVITDIHDVEQVKQVIDYVDVLQIPAFLCRQTDLLVEVGKAIANTNKAVNIKKGQFCNHIVMKHAYDKINNTIKEQRKLNPFIAESPNIFWNDQIWLCDRGNMYGYDDLVVDMRGLVQMRHQTDKVLVVQDATHALQQPNRSGSTHGIRYLIPTIARAAIATGINGLFMEVHDDPVNALSDAATQWNLKYLEPLLTELVAIHQATNGLENQYENH